MMEEMRAELLDLPEESGVGGGRNREVDEEEAQKVRYEEETFTRRTETKKDRAKAKKANVEAFDPLADIAGECCLCHCISCFCSSTSSAARIFIASAAQRAVGDIWWLWQGWAERSNHWTVKMQRIQWTR